MKTAEDWETMLASEGMPAELRLMTQSSVVARNGLVCVSASNKEHSPIGNPSQSSPSYGSREWTMNANFRHHGKPTAVFDLDIAEYWRLFSSLVWESGITGDNLEFLLEYAEGKELAPLERKYGLTNWTSKRLIAFIWSVQNHGKRTEYTICVDGSDVCTCGTSGDCAGTNRSGN